MLTNRLLQLQMLNRLNPFSLRLLRHTFSTVLSDGAQQALIAHTALDIIRFFKRQSYLRDTRSIRNRILDRAYFKSKMINFIRPTSNNGLKGKDITSEWIDSIFKEENYQAVLQAFQLYRGAPYDKQIWPQDRMFQQSINGRIILYPASTTSEFYNRLAEGQNGILSGMKGTGKSFSFFTYSYLSSFKAKYFANKQVNQQNELLLYGQPSVWQVVTQICYINLKDKLQYDQYYLQIANQFQYLYPLEQIEKDFKQNEIQQEQQKKKKEMENQKKKKVIEPQNKIQTQQQKKQKLALKKCRVMLQNLKKKAKNYKIQLICVIDEANRIFRLLRKTEAYINKHGVTSNWKETDSFKILAFYDSLFTIILDNQKYSFSHFILNSSQDFQLLKAKDAKDKFADSIFQQIPFIKIACMDRNFGKPRGTGYSQIMVRDIGKIELYNIFWFEIIKFVRKRKILGDNQEIYKDLQQKLTVYRAIFQNQFNISKDRQNRMIQDWKNEVQHLSIRQYMNSILFEEQYSFYCLYDNIFLTQHPNEQQITLFRRDLRKLKQNIEQSRKGQIIKSITEYIQKSTSFKECNIRRKYLNQIFKQANSYCSKGAVEDITNVTYVYLSSMALSVLEQKTLVQSIRIGFFDKQILKFGMSPQDLLQLISSALRDRQFNIQIARIAKDLIIRSNQKALNAEVGKFLDKVSLPFFVDGHFNLRYIEYQMKGEGNLSFEEPKAQQKQFSVGQTCPITGINKKSDDFDQVFNNIVQLADKNIEKSGYVGGFPVTFSQKQNKGKVANKGINKTSQVNGLQDMLSNNKDNSQGQNKGQVLNNKKQKPLCYAPLQNNILYDNIILKRMKAEKEDQIAQYDMILYDWTMGKPRSKCQKDFKTILSKFLSRSNIEGNIKCKLLIVAPDFLLQEHFNWWSNHRKLLTQAVKNQNLSFKPNLPDIYSHFSFTDTIKGVTYKRNVTVGLASFDVNSPFKLDTQSPSSVLIDFVTECYKLLTTKEIVSYQI